MICLVVFGTEWKWCKMCNRMQICALVRNELARKIKVLKPKNKIVALENIVQ